MGEISRWVDLKMVGNEAPANVRLGNLLDEVMPRRAHRIRATVSWRGEPGELLLNDHGELVARARARPAGDETEVAFEIPAEYRERPVRRFSLEVRGELTLRAVQVEFEPEVDSTDDSREIRVVLPVFETFRERAFPLSAASLRSSGLPESAVLKRIDVHGRTRRPSAAELSLGKARVGVLLLPQAVQHPFTLKNPVPAGELRELQLKMSEEFYQRRLELVFSAPVTSRGSPKSDSRFEGLFSRPYDRSQPLFFLHVAKCAGISFRSALRHWFDVDYYEHYLNVRNWSKPARVHLGPGSVIAGHFTRSDGVALETYYPDARQRITILRDPFEVAVSRYFFRKAEMENWARKYPQEKTLRDSLERCLSEKHPLYFDYLPEFAEGQSAERYLRENFLYVGLQDRLQDSADALAHLLGRPRVMVPKSNLSRYDETIPDLRSEFKRVFRREYELYDHARELHRQAGTD